jgi:transcriptional regulator with XRE-family HTH domain
MAESQMRENELLAQVGAGIRAWRKKAGLTMNQLAEMADIDGGFLATIETGKKAPSVITLAKLATALNVKLGDLFEQVPQREEPLDSQLAHQLKALSHGRSAAEKADLLALLKQLRDPARLKALRQLIRR